MRLRRRTTRSTPATTAGRRSEGVVGLDIGATHVRGVKVTHDRHGYRIVRAAEVPLRPGVVSQGEVVDAKALARALRSLWRRGRFGTRRVRFGLATSSVITRQVDLPWMPEPDFGTALRYQVSDALPVDLATVELDYHPLGEYSRTDQHGQSSEMSRILLTAANTEAVTGLADAIRRAHLTPVAADSAAFALIRTACSGALPPHGRLEALVDVGHDVVTVVLHDGGQPRFVRSVSSIGSGTVTEAIAGRFTLDTVAAEELKAATGLNGPVPLVTPFRESGIFGGLPVAPVEPADSRTQGVMAINSAWAGRVIGEIRNSVDYYLSSHPECELDRIVLTGGGSAIDGFTSRIQTELRVPVVPLALDQVTRLPRRGITVANPDALAVAAGLAMVA